MVNFCAAIGCSNRADRDKSTSFFRLPAVITNQGEETRERSRKRREQWLANINRPDMKETSYPYVRICSDHFVSGKPSTLYETASVDWAPTLRLGQDKDRTTSRKVRRKRKFLDDARDSIPALSACNPDLQLCPPFLNMAVEPYNRGVYKQLESKEAMDLLWLPDEIFQNKLPCRPARGEIYLLKIGPLQESGEWKKDGYEWVKRSSSVLTVNRNPALKKLSFFLSLKNRQDGLSIKHVYRLFSNNRKFVIHYLGSDEQQTGSIGYQQAMDISEVSQSQSMAGRSPYYCQIPNDTPKADSVYWDLASGNNDKQMPPQHLITDTMSGDEGTELISIDLAHHEQQRMDHSFNQNNTKIRGHQRSASETNHQQSRRIFPDMIPLQLPVEEISAPSVDQVELHSQRISKELQEQRRRQTNISTANNDSIIIEELESQPSPAKISRTESSFISHIPMTEVRFQAQPLFGTPEKEKRTLVIPNHQVSVMSNMFSLWKTGRLCDTYISNGTTNILIHKMILGAVCPKVLPILYGTPSNGFSKVTFPNSVSKEALLAFAEYMYNGVLHLDEDILLQLKIIAQRLDMKDFEQICNNELQKVRINSLLSTVFEPVFSEPASFSGLLSNSKQMATPASDSQPVDLSPLIKMLESSYHSARSQLPISKSAHMPSAAEVCSSTLMSRNVERTVTTIPGDSEINIKSEDDDNGCIEIIPIESGRLKVEPSSPNDNRYGIHDDLFIQFNNIPSNMITDSHLASSSADRHAIDNSSDVIKDDDDADNRDRELTFGYSSGPSTNQLSPSSPEIVNISDLNEAQLPKITTSNDQDDDDENKSRLVNEDNELELVPISSITTHNQASSDSSHVNNSDSLSYGPGLVSVANDKSLMTMQESDSLTSNQTPYPVDLFTANRDKLPVFTGKQCLIIKHGYLSK